MDELLVIGCSSRKTEAPGYTPALYRYDGPFYQDLRAHLRTYRWPETLDVAVLSAQFGLIGALTDIPNYDLRMSRERAAALAPELANHAQSWMLKYNKIHLCLGHDYMAALPGPYLENSGKSFHFKGRIGEKRQQLGDCLRSFELNQRRLYASRPKGRMRYFLPDWDDLVDRQFDFSRDTFSGSKGTREDVHCARLMRPYKIADGILVSLAQKRQSKGPLKYVGGLDPRTLRPINLRRHYGLDATQSLFGDCGAFSYVNETTPPITIDYAVSQYDLYNFDFGASIDHIPVPFVIVDGEKKPLTKAQRRRRVALTVDNADNFLRAATRRKAGFIPVGTVQGLSEKQFVNNANAYVEMGYSHIALGGLVPLPDEAVVKIVRATMRSLRQRNRHADVHLFGIFRPKLQSIFRGLGVASFDSATYFRKAWLRSEQNYLSEKGYWYAAIRVPMTSDGRTRNTMLSAGHNLAKLETLEQQALGALHDFDKGKLSVSAALEAVIAYDSQLSRSSECHDSVVSRYARTLIDKPWKHCPCPICKKLGIDVVIFRGSNRNKRRGAHNTWRLYNATRSSEKLTFADALEVGP